MAGFLGGALVTGRLFTSVLWGKLADAKGRRPALLMSWCSIFVGNIAFGFCTELKTALLVRAVFLGAGNGWVTVSSTYIGEVAGASRQNRVMGYVLSGGTLCQLVGPAVAAVIYGSLFPAYPALAPSLLGAGIAACAILLGYFWLEETHQPGGYAAVAADDAKNVEEPAAASSSALKTWPYVGSVLLRLALGKGASAGLEFARLEANVTWRCRGGAVAATPRL